MSAYQSMEAAAVQSPYLLLATVLLAVSGIFAIVKLPLVNGKNTKNELSPSEISDELYSNAWRSPQLILGAIGIFVYVGAEVSIGSFLVSFLTEPTITGLTAAATAKYVSMYWGGAMVGRFIGAMVMKKVKPGKLLAFNAACAALLVLATIFVSGHVAMATILSVGFFNSIMFPTIFSLALKDLGKHTGQGSGILCSAIVGGAVLPLFQGLVADQFGIQPAFFIPVFCYLYIVYYGCRDSILTGKV